MVLESPGIALVGIAGTVGAFAYVYRDATRIGMSRPRLWATIAAVPVAVGLGLYLFVPAAPTTGVIMTANTGLVLYTFEREVSTEDEESVEPGRLLDEPGSGSGGSLDSADAGEE